MINRRMLTTKIIDFLVKLILKKAFIYILLRITHFKEPEIVLFKQIIN